MYNVIHHGLLVFYLATVSIFILFLKSYNFYNCVCSQHLNVYMCYGVLTNVNILPKYSPELQVNTSSSRSRQCMDSTSTLMVKSTCKY